MEYAGFWRRALAIIIDAIIFTFLCLYLLSVTNVNFFWGNLIFQGLCAFYFIGMTASPYQATLGQMFLKIKIGTLTGSALSVLQSVFRYIMWGLPVWPFVIYNSLPTLEQVLQDNLEALGDVQGDVDQSLRLLDESILLLESHNMDAAIFMHSMFLGVMIIGGFIWMTSIAVNTEKAGIHDLICKQRTFKKEA